MMARRSTRSGDDTRAYAYLSAAYPYGRSISDTSIQYKGGKCFQFRQQYVQVPIRLKKKKKKKSPSIRYYVLLVEHLFCGSTKFSTRTDRWRSHADIWRSTEDPKFSRSQLVEFSAGTVGIRVPRARYHTAVRCQT